VHKQQQQQQQQLWRRAVAAVRVCLPSPRAEDDVLGSE
jgi:hypothetical protein